MSLNLKYNSSSRTVPVYFNIIDSSYGQTILLSASIADHCLSGENRSNPDIKDKSFLERDLRSGFLLSSQLSLIIAASTIALKQEVITETTKGKILQGTDYFSGIGYHHDGGKSGDLSQKLWVANG